MRGAWAERPAALKRLDLYSATLEPGLVPAPPAWWGYVFLPSTVSPATCRALRARLGLPCRGGRDLHPFHALPAAAPEGDNDGRLFGLPITAPSTPTRHDLADFEETVAAAPPAPGGGRHERGASDMGAEPHRQGTCLGSKSPARAIRPILDYYLTFPDATLARGLRADRARGFSGPCAGQFHLLRRHRPLGGPGNLVQRATRWDLNWAQSAGLPRDCTRSSCFSPTKGVEVLRLEALAFPVETESHPLPVGAGMAHDLQGRWRA